MHLLYFTISLLLFAATDEIKSNQQILDEKIIEAVVQSDMVTSTQRPFLLQISNVPDGLYHDLLSALLDDGKELKHSHGDHPVISVGLESNHYFQVTGRKEARRELNISINLSKTDAEQNIVDSKRLEISFEDTVPTENHDKLTGMHDVYQFNNVSYTGSGRFLRRIAEPALITTATAITIYLLYNVRSR